MAQCCLSLAVFVCVFWSVFMLYSMFYVEDSLRSFNYLPHLVILAGFCISLGQAIYVFSRKTDRD